ncbi:hypothetical protein VTK56DRAFT_6737 [Thermocarpiscus australiensis]
MPPRNRFPQFPALPQELQDMIWAQALSGPHISFLTVTQNPGPARPEGDETTVLQYSPLARLTRSAVDGEMAGGRYSTRTQFWAIAATCSGAYAAVERMRRRQGEDADGGHPGGDTLYVLEVGRDGEFPLGASLMLPTILLQRRSSKLAAMGFVWLPGDDDSKGPLRRSLSFLPSALKTLYLADMSRPLRLRSGSIGELRIRAGPWYGHQFAFVDLEPNPIGNLSGSGYLRGRSEQEAFNIVSDVDDLKQLFSDVYTPILPTANDKPSIELRILTPVVLSDG